jgi:hypothetical protein
MVTKCEFENGCNLEHEYVVVHEGNRFYLCQKHLDLYEDEHPFCGNCGDDRAEWWYLWHNGDGMAIEEYVCDVCADLIRDADDGTEFHEWHGGPRGLVGFLPEADHL